MTDEELSHSIETNEVHLTLWGKLNHYGIVGFLCLIQMLLISIMITNNINGRARSINELPIGGFIIATVLAFLCYKLQKRQLKFKSVETGLKRKEINDIIRGVAIELKWSLESLNENYIVAKSHTPFLLGFGGEQITMIFDQNRVLVNSICDPYKKSLVTSLGRNRRNMDKLLNKIKSRSGNIYQ
jgi:hypothetical protein